MATQPQGQTNPPPPQGGDQGQQSQPQGEPKQAAKPEDRQKAQQEVQELRRKLQDAEAKLAATGETRQTTADEDMKMLQDRAQSQKVEVVGRPGGPFTISGVGFGTSNGQPPWPGQVLIAGRTVPITSWRDTSIKGTLPPDLPEKGDVELTINGGAQTKEQKLKGTWPPPRTAGGRQVTIKTKEGNLIQGEMVDGLQQPGQGGQPVGADVYLPGAQGVQGGGPDKNPPPGSTGTMTGQQVGQAPSTATGGGPTSAGSGTQKT